MPSGKSHRVAERRRIRNTPLRSKAKTAVSKARHLIGGDEMEEAEKAVTAAVVSLDKAAQKGAIHRRNASRRKSRIMAQLHAAKSR